MTSVEIRGRARTLPNAVNTDYIISSRRKRQIQELHLLVDYIFEDLPEPLNEPIAPGDILVAGRDFGCGSAMEVAVDVLIAAGVQAIVATSAARTFQRNAINAGLPLVTVPDDVADEGDVLRILYAQEPFIENVTRGDRVYAKPVPRFAVRLFRKGGLISHYRREGMPQKGML